MFETEPSDSKAESIERRRVLCLSFLKLGIIQRGLLTIYGVADIQ
jgi:hypothetical protein